MQKKAFKVFKYIFTVCIFACVIQVLITQLELFEKLEFFQQNSEAWKSALKQIFSFITANIVNIIKLICEHRQEKNNSSPYLRITIQSMTNIRKNKNPKYVPEIVLGSGNRFIYILAELENTGNGYIEEFVFAKQKPKICPIKHEKKEYIFFRVCRQENSRFKKKYPIRIYFKDEKNYCYFQKAKLIIHEETNKAIIVLNKRQRRISEHEFNDKN